ncbi:MAG: FAD-dependent oxidoreductase [Myxococcota bacterium]
MIAVDIANAPDPQSSSIGTPANRFLLGASASVAARLLGSPSDASERGSGEAPLAKRIVRHIHCRERRASYVAAAADYLRTKHPPLERTYDVVVVGAGIHAAMFAYTLGQLAPGTRVLMVERSTDICATFGRLGDALILNSPTFAKVGLDSNLFPGHFVQLSDFDELAHGPFPTAKHLHELATMVMFHADADIAFGFEVVKPWTRDGGTYVLSSPEQTVRTKSIVVANGTGPPRRLAFAESPETKDRYQLGDDFMRRCYEDEAFTRGLAGKRVAVVGSGDTANSVMEYLLPLVYPSAAAGLGCDVDGLPAHILWLGQSARTIKEFFFNNKLRYCHSGGLIEFLWCGDEPFDLSPVVWERAKELVTVVPEHVRSISSRDGAIRLETATANHEADVVIDCSGRFNSLSDALLRGRYEYVTADIGFYGGRWCDRAKCFVGLPKRHPDRRIACRLAGERVFVVGAAAPLHELVADDEAKNGAQRYQEDRTSLTNSKWSLEHTLPRTVALAERYLELSGIGRAAPTSPADNVSGS